MCLFTLGNLSLASTGEFPAIWNKSRGEGCSLLTTPGFRVKLRQEITAIKKPGFTS